MTNNYDVVLYFVRLCNIGTEIALFNGIVPICISVQLCRDTYVRLLPLVWGRNRRHTITRSPKPLCVAMETESTWRVHRTAVVLIKLTVLSNAQCLLIIFKSKYCQVKTLIVNIHCGILMTMKHWCLNHQNLDVIEYQYQCGVGIWK